MKLLAKEYKTRSELEDAVRNKIGLTTDRKDHTIEGTAEELARLHLSPSTIFWGCSCVIADEPIKPAQEVVQEKPDRGEVVASGININNDNQ